MSNKHLLLRKGGPKTEWITDEAKKNRDKEAAEAEVKGVEDTALEKRKVG